MTGAEHRAFWTLLHGLQQQGRQARTDDVPAATQEQLWSQARTVLGDAVGESPDPELLVLLRCAFNDGYQPNRINLDDVVMHIRDLGHRAHLEYESASTVTIRAGGRADASDQRWCAWAGTGTFDAPQQGWPVGDSTDFYYGPDTGPGSLSRRVPVGATAQEIAALIVGVVEHVNVIRFQEVAGVDTAFAAFWKALSGQFPGTRHSDGRRYQDNGFGYFGKEAARAWIRDHVAMFPPAPQPGTHAPAGTPAGPDRQYSYDIAGGTVRVRILASDTSASRVDGRTVIEHDHRVEVTTDEGVGAGRKPGYVKVRGRRYRIDRLHRRERDPWTSPQGRPVQWTLSHRPFGGGFLNDRDGEVSHLSKTYEALRQIELEVLERFEAENPDWRMVSERMSDMYERQRWQEIAETRRTELAEAEQRIAYLTARIAS